MQCHYCSRPADITVEKHAITVGVCKTHFRERMQELAETEWLEDVEDDLDLDSPE